MPVPKPEIEPKMFVNYNPNAIRNIVDFQMHDVDVLVHGTDVMYDMECIDEELRVASKALNEGDYKQALAVLAEAKSRNEHLNASEDLHEKFRPRTPVVRSRNFLPEDYSLLLEEAHVQGIKANLKNFDRVFGENNGLRFKLQRAILIPTGYYARLLDSARTHYNSLLELDKDPDISVYDRRPNSCAPTNVFAGYLREKLESAEVRLNQSRKS